MAANENMHYVADAKVVINTQQKSTAATVTTTQRIINTD